ncbi:hypothetical protein Megvenef_00800 [Candidatus Megaera venefica]|uniref:DUF4345 domain-containing protein n=1 Tax=Candidatus Megaera venefica TaxID=2055910 RepID=A0ABU5NCC1_9RICK|nr:hypothetical protein [Candidatus Megaera venefica]MEA0970831.1 hypothetical protein [Candidatus Megaera venefica]
MNNRPRSVTIVCWILIVTGVLGLVFYVIADLSMDHKQLFTLMEHQRHIPGSVQYALGYFALFVSISSGIAMLYGKNWARFLYLGYHIFSFSILILSSSYRITLIHEVIMFAIFTFILFRSSANQYFKSNAYQAVIKNENI